MWWAFACEPAGTVPSPVRDPPPVAVPDDPPVLVDGPLVVEPTAAAPYVRRITLTFDRPVIVTGSASDGPHTIPVATELTATPSFALIGLYADRTWTTTLTATAEDGGATELDPVTFATEPLPADFPVVDLRASGPAAEPGFTLVPIVDDSSARLVVFDRDGEVAWTWSEPDVSNLVECIPTGTGVIFLEGNVALHEIDWEGRELRTFVTSLGSGGTPIGLPAFSHEVGVLPDGRWLTLSRETIARSRYPLDYDDPTVLGPAAVAGDRIVELDPATGEVLVDVRLAPLLDPRRIGYDSLDEVVFGRDWTHGNSVVVDEAADAWIVSLRHQDAVISVGRATGALRWILGPHDNWGAPWQPYLLAPVGTPFRWPWHQHAAKWLGDGDLVLFDNGNLGASPFTGEATLPESETHSRVVRFHVDEAAMTVSQVWEFEPDPFVASTGMGDADVLPGGTVLATFALVSWIGGVATTDLGRGASSIELVEFEPGTGEVVWDLDLWSPGTALWSYRAERFASFGPGGVLPD